MKAGSKLYLTRAQIDRVVDRIHRAEASVICQHSGIEVNTRDVRRIHIRNVPSVEDIETFGEQLEPHMLSEPDPLRDTQVGRRSVRTTVDVTQERNA